VAKVTGQRSSPTMQLAVGRRQRYIHTMPRAAQRSERLAGFCAPGAISPRQTTVSTSRPRPATADPGYLSCLCRIPVICVPCLGCSHSIQTLHNCLGLTEPRAGRRVPFFCWGRSTTTKPLALPVRRHREAKARRRPQRQSCHCGHGHVTRYHLWWSGDFTSAA
jgi:hypothetical protein